MTPRYTSLLFVLLLAAPLAAQPVPDTLRAPAEADSITVFGWTVDADADRLLVGARVWPPPTARPEPPERADHHGTVFVYRRTAGTWKVEGRLRADYISNEDCFSWAMDLRGDLAVIGAECEYGQTSEGLPYSGAVYVFRYDGEAWRRDGKLVFPFAEDEVFSIYGFGASVSLGEGYLVAGAGTSRNPANPEEDYGSGAAYVFERAGDTWSLAATLTNDDADEQINEYFGATVAAAGDHILIGAPSISSSETVRSGAVYVFARTGGGWVQTEKITAPVPVALDYFGSLLAAESEGAVVGSWTAVYPLERAGGEWSIQPRLTTGDYPWAVARSGDHILTVDAGTDEGTTGHLFTRSGTHWSEAAFALSRFTAGRDEQVSLTTEHAFVGIPEFGGGQVLVYDLEEFVADEPAAEAPPTLALSVAPNPMLDAATVRFDLTQTGTVRLTVYDVLGREVARLVEAVLPAGSHAVGLPVRDLAAGSYLVRLTTDGQAVSRLVTVLR